MASICLGLNVLNETGSNGHKINNACHIKSNNKWSASVINHNFNSVWKAIVLKVDLTKCYLAFLIIPERYHFQCFRVLVVDSY